MESWLFVNPARVSYLVICSEWCDISSQRSFLYFQVATIAWFEADAVCGSHQIAIPLVLVFPYICRLLQCLRQYKDTKEKSSLLNGKSLTFEHWCSIVPHHQSYRDNLWVFLQLWNIQQQCLWSFFLRLNTTWCPRAGHHFTDLSGFSQVSSTHSTHSTGM